MATRKVYPPINIGDRFGRLTVLNEATAHYSSAGFMVRRWRCQCDCGTTKEIRAASLKNGVTISCGCKAREGCSTLAERACLVHADARAGARAPEYGIYRAMLSRCFNPKVERYPLYGGRGITVCDRWRGSEGYPHFLADMGRRPTPAHSLDRKNVDGNYTPENVRWAVAEVQGRNRTNNRRVEYAGRFITLAEAAEISGIKRATLANRLNQGWPIERAMAAPLRRRAQP